MGGKPRKGSGRMVKRGRGTKNISVVALVERGRSIVVKPTKPHSQ